MASAEFTDAYARCLTKFPTLASLGAGTPPALWLAELAVLDPGAFDAVTGTTVSFESGSFAGTRNFAQMNKVRALHAVRAYLDPSYTNPYTAELAEPVAGRRAGSVVRTPR